MLYQLSESAWAAVAAARVWAAAKGRESLGTAALHGAVLPLSPKKQRHYSVLAAVQGCPLRTSIEVMVEA